MDPWWAQQFAQTRELYQQWIKNGRVETSVGGIEVPGWNLHNRLTLILHAENYVESTYELLKKFVHGFDVDYADQLVDFQRATVIDYAKLSQLPQQQNFDWDFLGYLQNNSEFKQPSSYKFDSAEDKNMSPRMFLENFYFGRKRNFGKAIILPIHQN